MAEQESSKENRGYSVERVDDEFWPALLIIRDVPVAKFESTALASTVSGLLNQEYFPSRRQRIAEAIVTGGFSLLTSPNLQSLEITEELP
jgi:hypothetical protein